MSEGPLVRLRAATTDDDALLEELFRGAQPELALLPLPADQVEALIALQWQAQRSGYASDYPEAVDWVIEADGVPVGRLLVDAGPPITYVDIAVLPQHRGAGVAPAVMRIALSDADARGVAARVRTRRDNPVQRMLLRLGFVVDGGDELDLFMVREPAPRSG